MIGGKSYDDYLREQERKNRGQGLSGGSTYRPEVPEVEETSHMTQTPPAKKKMQPVSLFFIMFGAVFFLFGLMFIALFIWVVPMSDEVPPIIFLGPGIFMVIGLAIMAAGIYYARTGKTPRNVTINGISAEEYNRSHGYEPEETEEETEWENEEDSSRLTTDRKS